MPTGGHADGRALQAWAVTLPFPQCIRPRHGGGRLSIFGAIGALSEHLAGPIIAAPHVAAATRPLTFSHPHPLPHLSTSTLVRALACRVARLRLHAASLLALRREPIVRVLAKLCAFLLAHPTPTRVCTRAATSVHLFRVLRRARRRVVERGAADRGHGFRVGHGCREEQRNEDHEQLHCERNGR